MSKPDFNRLIELQALLLNFHLIERRVRHPGNFERHETDTEHSYTLAMTGWFLAQYFPQLDTNAIIRLALTHDLVEIYAGDTYVYGDKEALRSKVEREKLALTRLEHEWRDFPEMLAAIEQYELKATEEAKFIYALDKLMPMILNYLNHGRTWRYEKISLKQVINEKMEKIAISPEIYTYYQVLLAILKKHPEYFLSTQMQA